VELLPPGPLSALDAGCGRGFLSAQLAALGHRVTAIDTAASSLAVAKAASTQIRFEQRSVYDPLSDLAPEGGWDLVMAIEVIEHLFAPAMFLARVSEVLKPGGHLVLSTPYHGYVKNLAISLTDGWDDHFSVHYQGGHIKFFSPRTLRSLLGQAGFTDVRFRFAGRVPLLWKSMICRARLGPRPRRDASAVLD
jgi:2-polyprenyl-3-methyl-5-hydroxy-6-metoxy-1,4-benzoquinol methylase